MRLGIIGVGRAGGRLCRAFTESGHTIAAVWDTDSDAGRRVAGEVGSVCAPPPEWSRFGLDAVLIAVPDSKIAEVAFDLARHPLPAPVVLHISGAAGEEVLRPLQGKGCSLGSMHPLLSFASGSASPLEGARFAVGGDDRAVAVAEELAWSVGAIPLPIRPDQKAAYHAAACLCSNYLVVLAWLAQKTMAAAGLSEDFWPGYLDLIRGTLDNLGSLGPEGALTGPVARGDIETVSRHRDALQGQPLVWECYRQMGLAALAMAEASESISPAQVNEMSRVLKE